MKILIGPYTYQVEFERSHNGAADTWGHIRYGEQLIRVDSDLKPERQRVCLMHEVLHAIFEAAGQDNEAEEKLITAISPALVDALRRNPDMTAFLMQEGEATP